MYRQVNRGMGGVMPSWVAEITSASQKVAHNPPDFPGPTLKGRFSFTESVPRVNTGLGDPSRVMQ